MNDYLYFTMLIAVLVVFVYGITAVFVHSVTEPSFSAFKTLDVVSLKKLTLKDVVVIPRKCKDLEGKENHLSISAIRIKESKSKVMEYFADPQILADAVPDIKTAKIIKRYSDNEFEVEYEAFAKLFAGIKISTKFISHTVVGRDYIYSFVKEGKNKNGWRITEFLEDNGSTIVTLSICENLKGFPVAGDIIAANPHYESGILSSNGVTILTNVKKYIEDKKLKQDGQKNQ